MEDTQSEKLSWFRNSPLKEPNPLPLHCLIAVKTPPVNYFHSQLRCLTKNYLNNCVNKRLLLFITNALFSSFFKFAWQLFLLSNSNSNLHRLDSSIFSFLGSESNVGVERNRERPVDTCSNHETSGQLGVVKL